MVLHYRQKRRDEPDQNVDPLSLALAQAAAYMNANGISVAQYIKLAQTAEKR